MKKKQEKIDKEALLLTKSFEEHVLKFKAIHKIEDEDEITEEDIEEQFQAVKKIKSENMKPRKQVKTISRYEDPYL